MKLEHHKGGDLNRFGPDIKNYLLLMQICEAAKQEALKSRDFSQMLVAKEAVSRVKAEFHQALAPQREKIWDGIDEMIKLGDVLYHLEGEKFAQACWDAATRMGDLLDVLDAMAIRESQKLKHNPA